MCAVTARRKESKPSVGKAKSCQKSQSQMVFRVKIAGHSMAPKFPGGSWVYFSLLQDPGARPDFDRIAPGKCYFVELGNGSRTFRELAERREDGLLLRATNKKVRRKIFVPLKSIVRLAACSGVLVSDGKEPVTSEALQVADRIAMGE